MLSFHPYPVVVDPKGSVGNSGTLPGLLSALGLVSGDGTAYGAVNDLLSSLAAGYAGNFGNGGHITNLDFRRLSTGQVGLTALGAATLPTLDATGLAMPGDGGCYLPDITFLTTGLLLIAVRWVTDDTNQANADNFGAGMRIPVLGLEGKVLGGGCQLNTSGPDLWRTILYDGDDDAVPDINTAQKGFVLQDGWSFMFVARINSTRNSHMSGYVLGDGTDANYGDHEGSSAGLTDLLSGETGSPWLYSVSADVQYAERMVIIQAGLT